MVEWKQKRCEWARDNISSVREWVANSLLKATDETLAKILGFDQAVAISIRDRQIFSEEQIARLDHVFAQIGTSIRYADHVLFLARISEAFKEIKSWERRKHEYAQHRRELINSTRSQIIVKKKGTVLSASRNGTQGIRTWVPATFRSDSDTELNPPFSLHRILSSSMPRDWKKGVTQSRLFARTQRNSAALSKHALSHKLKFQTRTAMTSFFKIDSMCYDQRVAHSLCISGLQNVFKIPQKPKKILFTHS